MKKLLAICYLVKDEAAILEHSLASVCGVADEVNIIDNGSSDNLQEIAQKYGAKIIRNAELDFDKAKNCFFSASESEWILSLDSDEEMRIEDIEKLKDYLVTLPEDVRGVYLPRFEYIGCGRWAEIKILRVLKNNCGTKFENIAIHSTPSKSIKQGKGRITEMYAPIHHMDVFYKGRALEKRKRNIDRLVIVLEEDVHNYQLMNYLALEYSAIGDFDRAENLLKRAQEVTLAVRPGERARRAWLYLAQLYYFLGEYDKAKGVINEILDFDLYWNETKFNVMAKIEHKLENPVKALQYVDESLKCANSPGALINKGYLLKRLGDSESEYFIEQAKKRNPYWNNPIIWDIGEKPCIYDQQCLFLDFDTEELKSLLFGKNNC